MRNITPEVDRVRAPVGAITAKAVKMGVLGALLVGVLAACGVFTDATPPTVYASLVTDEVGVVSLVVTGSDADSGVTYLSVSRVNSNGDLVTLADEHFDARDAEGVIVPSREMTVTRSVGDFYGATVVARNGVNQEASRVILDQRYEPVWPSELPSTMVVGSVIEDRVQLGDNFESVEGVHVVVGGVSVPTVAYPLEKDYGFTWSSVGMQPGVYTLVISVELESGDVFTFRHRVTLVVEE